MQDRRVTYDEACRILGCTLSDEEIQEFFEPCEIEASRGVFVPLEGNSRANCRPLIRNYDVVRLSDVARYVELRKNEYR